MVLGVEVGLSQGDFVLDGDPATLPKKGAERPPQFSAHFYCGQTSQCIKMPLGMEVGLSPGTLCSMGTQPSLPQKGVEPPIFGPCLLWQNGWMDQDGTWHGDRPLSRRLCVRWGPNPLPKQGSEPLPQFSTHFYCGQRAGCIKIPLGMELSTVSLRPKDFVLDGDLPPPKKGAGPQNFRPMFIVA